MSSNNKKLSSRQYLLQHAEDFKLADFYVYFNYAARQEAEYMLKGAITLLSKKRKNISKAVKNLLDMVQNDEYAYLKNEAIEVYWTKVEARNKQMRRFYFQNEVQSEIDTKILNDIRERELRQREQAEDQEQENENQRQKKKQGDQQDEEGEPREEVDESQKQEDEQGQGSRQDRKRRYVLDISEVQRQPPTKFNKIDARVGLKERLKLSSITIDKNIELLPTHTCSPVIYSLVKQWRSAIEEKKDIFFPSFLPSSELCIYNMLSAIFVNLKRESPRALQGVKYKYVQSELDYTINHVSPILQNIFSTDDSLSINWQVGNRQADRCSNKLLYNNRDTTSFSTKEIRKECVAYRPDCIIISSNGVEVGVIEIKPLNTCNELINIDKAKVAELCKRQLHLRLKTAKLTKELVTFGITITGKDVSFSSLKLELDGTYRYTRHDEITLPSFADTFHEMGIFLEKIFSFKNIIIKSLANENDKGSINIFDQYSHLIKPTIAFENRKKK